ncbi:hypothetical protein FHR32_002080 [Streptosporangium album]|uniref:Uncharacterized protein n=1 Tax=Streptosporangium album TaxID=47479 RepID=A0A7W7RT80_9ACTN|nr:hypothetical protein [Streptosporangium album]
MRISTTPTAPSPWIHTMTGRFLPGSRGVVTLQQGRMPYGAVPYGMRGSAHGAPSSSGTRAPLNCAE